MKNVLVTGATGEIGMQIARAFAQNGYNVAVHTFSKPEEAQKLCDELCKSYNVKAVSVKADVSKKNDVDEMAEKIKKELGGIDVLVNNSGISQIKMLCDVTEEDWDRMFDVNVKGAYLCINAFSQNMVRNKFGRIINISSVWGVCGASCEVHYSASKSALVGLTKALAKELAPSGVTINCISPGLIDTKMNSHLSKEELCEIINNIPVGRMGKPEDVANACLFFASENSSYVTGQNLNVDGAWI